MTVQFNFCCAQRRKESCGEASVLGRKEPSLCEGDSTQRRVVSDRRGRRLQAPGLLPGQARLPPSVGSTLSQHHCSEAGGSREEQAPQLRAPQYSSLLCLSSLCHPDTLGFAPSLLGPFQHLFGHPSSGLDTLRTLQKGLGGLRGHGEHRVPARSRKPPELPPQGPTSPALAATTWDTPPLASVPLSHPSACVTRSGRESAPR